MGNGKSEISPVEYVEPMLALANLAAGLDN